MLIYLCEDSATQRLAIAAKLRPFGTVLEFSDSESLLKALRAVTPSIVILDVSVPDKNAIELLLAGSLPAVPVLLISWEQSNLDAARLVGERRSRHNLLGALHKKDLDQIVEAIAQMVRSE